MTPPAFGSLVFGYFSKEGMEIKLVLHEAWIMVTLHLTFQEVEKLKVTHNSYQSLWRQNEVTTLRALM